MNGARRGRLAHLPTTEAVRAKRVQLKTRLEVVGAVVSVGSAVFLGSLLIAGLPLTVVALYTVGAAGAAAGSVLWLRRTHPAIIDPAEDTDDDPASADSDDKDRWTIGDFVFVGLFTSAFVLVAIMLHFFLPLAILVGFWILSPTVSIWSVLTAAGCCLVTLALFEFAVELPLLKRWGIPLDAARRKRSDFCPAPEDSEDT